MFSLDPSSCPFTELHSRKGGFKPEATPNSRHAGLRAKPDSHHARLRVISGDNDAFSQKNAPSSIVRAVRPLPMRLVTVRKTLDSGAQSLVNEYVTKVKRYCSFQELQIRPNPKNTSDVVAQVEAEGDRVSKTISAKDWVILLDERGRDVTSEQLATTIAEAGDTGASALVFCIGGPYGHGAQVRKRANLSIKVSSMTLNHQVAMIVLLEQIYRAWTILRGEKYHH